MYITDVDLLVTVLGYGRAVAADLIQRYGSISGVVWNSSVRGIAGVQELVRRAGIPAERGRDITAPRTAYQEALLSFDRLEQEQFVVLFLDARNRVTGREVLYKGTVNEVKIRIAEVFRSAIRRNAPAIIIAHNHPSGDPTPGKDDLDLTDRLLEASITVEVALLDHIIVGGGTFVSIRDTGKLTWVTYTQ